MRWRGRRQSSNVEDMRGSGSGGGGGFSLPTRNRRGGGFGVPMGRNQGGFRIPMGGASRARGGGMGCGTLIVFGVILWVLGINPLTFLLGGLGGGLSGGGGLSPQYIPQQTSPSSTNRGKKAASNDEMAQFVSTILGSTEEVWGGVFKAYGKQYPNPRLVLFDGSVRSACGLASAATGPFYCPGDSKVYIDLSFYRELAEKFQAKGDFAQAYVLAHEVGHHVQNILGVLPQFNRMRRSMGKLEANKLSIRVELQADCFAGVWGHYVQQQGWLDRGDLEEALIAANQIGDDTIQKRTQGYVVPEAFNHGSSEQRRYWFRRGFEKGRIESCDTFNVSEKNL